MDWEEETIWTRPNDFGSTIFKTEARGCRLRTWAYVYLTHHSDNTMCLCILFVLIAGQNCVRWGRSPRLGLLLAHIELLLICQYRNLYSIILYCLWLCMTLTLKRFHILFFTGIDYFLWISSQNVYSCSKHHNFFVLIYKCILSAKYKATYGIGFKRLWVYRLIASYASGAISCKDIRTK